MGSVFRVPIGGRCGVIRERRRSRIGEAAERQNAKAQSRKVAKSRGRHAVGTRDGDSRPLPPTCCSWNCARGCSSSSCVDVSDAPVGWSGTPRAWRPRTFASWRFAVCRLPSAVRRPPSAVRHPPTRLTPRLTLDPDHRADRFVPCQFLGAFASMLFDERSPHPALVPPAPRSRALPSDSGATLSAALRTAPTAPPPARAT